MRTVAFVVDQKQDFYLSLAWARLLRERHAPVMTLAVLTHGFVLPEFTPHLEQFDRVEVTEAPYAPRRLRQIPGMVLLLLRFRRAVRALGLDNGDVAVGYSFRAFVLTAFIRALDPRPRLVRIRQCTHELERHLTRRRPLVSLYWNLWNRLAGTGPMRYRWLPSSNRVGGGTFLHDPYDDEFCLTTATRADPDAGRLAWPFAVLRDSRSPSGSPTLVFLGERYPLVEGQQLDTLRPLVQRVLDRIRELHPHHRLVFKPRPGMPDLGLDLDGWESSGGEAVLESLLMTDTTIEKVFSFKSSGSAIASQYGCAGYLLYPLLDLPPDYRAHLDAYFASYRDDMTFVEDLTQVMDGEAPRPVDAARAAALAQPLIDLLSGAA